MISQVRIVRDHSKRRSRDHGYIGTSGRAEHGAVHVHLPIKVEDQQRIECVWAEPLGGNRFRIKSIPFFHGEAHFLDVVEAMPDDGHASAFRFVRVVEPKGNGTILFTYRSRETFDRCAAIARQHRATLEGGRGPSGGHPGLAAMSVPPEAWFAIERWFDRKIAHGVVSVETYDEPIASHA